MKTNRNYITTKELENILGITITDEQDAIKKLNIAEQIIDDYVKFQDRSIKYDITGIATGGTTTTLIDTNTDSHLIQNDDGFLAYMTLQIVSGTNAGESRIVYSSEKTTGTITVTVPFSEAVDSTSVYLLKQVGKFPRVNDYHFSDSLQTYYKYIIPEVKSAVAYQYEYISEQGESFFTGAGDIFESESIGNYSYKLKDGNISKIVSSTSKILLSGIRNIKGKMV